MELPEFTHDFAQRGPAAPPVTGQTPTTEAYPAINLAFNHFNHELFRGSLPFPLFVFHRSDRFLGHYCPDRFLNRRSQKADEMMLNAAAFAINAVEETMSTLVHEMAHQFQRKFGTPGRRGYHNREFADIMLAVGLCPSATGLPGGAQTGEKMTHYIVKDGPFQISCARLLVHNPGIVWFDRVMIRRNRRHVGPLNSDEGSAPTRPSSTRPLDEPASSGAEEDQPEFPPMAVFDRPQDNSVPGMEVVDASVAKKPTRWKYTCPAAGCGLNLWGKPNVRARCDQHNMLLVQAEA